MKEHQVCEAARLLGRAAAQFCGACVPAALPSPAAATLLMPLSSAMEEVASAIEAIKRMTAADGPTRVWLTEASEHIGESASELFTATLESEEAAEVSATALSAGAALSLSHAADELSRHASPDQLVRPCDADFAELLPLLVDAIDEVSTAVHRLGDACTADQDAGAHLAAAAEQMGEGTQRLADAQEGLVEVGRVARTGRAAEAAWAAGAEHGRMLRPAAITREGDRFTVNGAAGAALAAALGETGPADVDPVAAGAYCAAYADAAGLQGPAVAFTGRYVPGQQVITALGRTGVLTGDADRAGRPRVRFSGGRTAIVPREAILAPLAHMFRTLADAKHAQGVDDGDVLLVTSDKTAWVQVEGRPLPACEQTARLGRRQCGYEESVRLAEKMKGLMPGSMDADAPTAFHAAVLEFPAPVTPGPPPSPKARAARPPHRTNSPTRHGRRTR